MFYTAKYLFLSEINSLDLEVLITECLIWLEEFLSSHSTLQSSTSQSCPVKRSCCMGRFISNSDHFTSAESLFLRFVSRLHRVSSSTSSTSADTRDRVESCCLIQEASVRAVCVSRYLEEPTMIAAFNGKQTGKHVVHVACGSTYSAAITADGELYTWGRGNYGRLGHGTCCSALSVSSGSDVGL